MKKYYLLFFIIPMLTLVTYSCSNEDESDYLPISGEANKNAPQSNGPITLDLTQVPLAKLSDYHFFTGPLHNQTPAYMVIPYEPASSLFSDYAHKKRFVWMPKGTHASYDGDGTVLNFPVGAALIKTFYYENVQPANATKIIETRLMVRKNDGWKLYDYIWNDSQTEAFLDTNGNGMNVPVTWTENSVTRTISYRVPSQTECTTCHNTNPGQTGAHAVPIGPKPQNLNTVFNYGNVTRNQLQRWRTLGYINNTLPQINTIVSTVNWKDASKPLELRARSYIDINCAHCHRDGGECAYAPQRLNFDNTDTYTYGICLPPLFQSEQNPFVINSGNADRSDMVFRMNTNDGAQMMPLIGRTIIDEEGVQLVKDWINSMTNHCD